MNKLLSKDAYTFNSFILLLLKKLSSLELILALRACSILIQLSLVLFVNLVLGYALPWIPLLTIIFAEVVFNGISFFIFNNKGLTQKRHILFQLLADILFLGALLYFSGGATNAFVSLLLVPIAIGAVALPVTGILTLALTAIGIYSLLLWLMPMHVMHGNMEGHFIGMWINFLFSAIVVSIVVAQMAKAITKKELTIAKYREEQLKQERILALGVASAQVTHDLATPIASIRLLVDELKDDGLDDAVIADLDSQIQRCSDKLANFRATTEEIRQNKFIATDSNALFKQIKQYCQLYYPHIQFEFVNNAVNSTILADSSLIPAMLNTINNAVSASEHMGSNKVKITSVDTDNKWTMSIADEGKGFEQSQFAIIGSEVMDSQKGLGIAMLLSNASLERHNGHLFIKNNTDKGAEVVITLPIVEQNV